MMTKAELLDELAKYSDEELIVALKAAEALKRTHQGNLYFLHHFLCEDLPFQLDENAGECVIDLPVSELVMNPLKITHGGIIALLCDNAMGVASFTAAKRRGVTLELSVRYHTPGRGKRLRAKGMIVARSNLFNSTRCEVVDDEGNLVASATGTFYHRLER